MQLYKVEARKSFESDWRQLHVVAVSARAAMDALPEWAEEIQSFKLIGEHSPPFLHLILPKT